jgi:hypothetical protein
MEVIAIRMYSFRTMSVPRKKYFRSKVAKRALGVEMTLLSRILMVLRLADGVLTLSG